MNSCKEVQSGLTEYLDGRLSGREMQEIDAHLQACPECARESRSLRELQASLAGLGPVPEPGLAPADSCGCEPGARAQPPQHLAALGTWRGKTPWVPSCCRQRGICQRRAAAGDRRGAGHHVCPAGNGPGHARRAAGQRHRAALALFLQCAGRRTRSAPLGPGGGRSVCQRRRARCTTTASSPAPPIEPPGPRLRTCCCSAVLSRRGSSASLFAAWRCCRSPAFRCAGKNKPFAVSS